jgi:hypothetical protein
MNNAKAQRHAIAKVHGHVEERSLFPRDLFVSDGP